MHNERWRAGFVLVLVLAVGACAAGCGRTKDQGEKGHGKPTQVAARSEGHDHSGWWCAEHGVPEEICGLCNPKYAAECKKKGDWCPEHDRPESQCFLHHPELKARFAALYRAKYGKEPPPTEEEEADKEATAKMIKK
jgi:hypothetical protein